MTSDSRSIGIKKETRIESFQITIGKTLDIKYEIKVGSFNKLYIL